MHVCACRIATLEKRVSQLTKEKELMEKKMQRLERAKDQVRARVRLSGQACRAWLLCVASPCVLAAYGTGALSPRPSLRFM